MRSTIIGLLLLITSEMLAQKPYKGGEIYTNESWRYGKIEMRMQMVSGSGILSTFFTYKNGSEVSGEFWEEIDIEVFGKDNATTFQSNIITNYPKTYSEQVHSPGYSMADAYHTFTLEWTPDYVAWYIDGIEMRKTIGGQVYELTNPESFRFNLWAANIVEWVGAFDPNVLPVYQFVNWIKYSTYTPGTGDNGTDFTLDWTDDFDTFNTSRWSKANWTFNENLADFDPNNVLVRDGYLVLVLSREGQTGFSGIVPEDIISDPTPTVSITSPLANDMFCYGNEIEITADADVSSGSIQKVDFYNGNTFLGTDETSPYSYTWTNATTGSQTIRAIATSDADVESLVSTLDIAVNETPSAPVVTSPVVYTQNSTANALTANGTDLYWFSSATEETGTEIAPIPSTSIVGNTSYFVSQTINSCESDRSEIVVTINPEELRTITLHTGWNLIGCPFEGETDVSEALSSIWDNVEIVKSEDAYYDPSQDDFLNSLQTLSWGKGYFVKVNADCELVW